MATYNGAKNIAEQLASIQNQTTAPRELVICDDGSVDGTIGIIEKFRSSSKIPVRLILNENKLGITDNFFKAAQLCQSEYVAFCDQDDIWRPDKIMLCSNASRFTPDLIIHDAVDFYVKNGKKIWGQRLRPSRAGLYSGVDVNPELIWPGMSMVVRKDMLRDAARLQRLWRPYRDAIRDERPEILYIHWADAHDLCVLNIARMGGSIFVINKVLAEHRTNDGGRHSGAGPRATKSGLREIPEIEEKWRSRARNYRLWSLYCNDYVIYLHKVGADELVIERFRRWSKMYRCRAIIHAEDTTRKERFQALAANVRSNAYRDKWSAGFGWRSFVKDVWGLVR